MKGFWIKFEDGSAGYCEGLSPFDAQQIAERLHGQRVAVENGVACIVSLPYPADPVIWQFEHPVTGKTPTLCFNPQTCAGNRRCPRYHPCTE